MSTSGSQTCTLGLFWYQQVNLTRSQPNDAKCLDSTQALFDLFDCGLEIPPAPQFLYSLALGWCKIATTTPLPCDSYRALGCPRVHPGATWMTWHLENWHCQHTWSQILIHVWSDEFWSERLLELSILQILFKEVKHLALSFTALHSHAMCCIMLHPQVIQIHPHTGHNVTYHSKQKKICGRLLTANACWQLLWQLSCTRRRRSRTPTHRAWETSAVFHCCEYWVVDGCRCLHSGRCRPSVKSVSHGVTFPQHFLLNPSESSAELKSGWASRPSYCRYLCSTECLAGASPGQNPNGRNSRAKQREERVEMLSEREWENRNT